MTQPSSNTALGARSPLARWLDQRTGLLTALADAANRPVAGGVSWLKVWPAAIAFMFCVQAITGFFLWVYYSPSAQTAWESVYFIQHHVAGGWFIRAVHHYSAHCLVALALVYVLQTILLGRYRQPRELVFWVAIGIALCAAAGMLTGDLLPWDANGYSATKTRTGFLTAVPLVGQHLLKLAIGGPGPALGSHSLTRFFALHVGVVAPAILLLLLLHVVLSRRSEQAEIDTIWRPEPYWPKQAVRNAVVCAAALVVVLMLACSHGVSGPERGVRLLSPADADPASAYAAARPEWFLLGVYEFSHWFSGALIPIFIVPGLAVCYLLAMPWIARLQFGHLFNVGLTGLSVLGVIVLSWITLAKDARDEQHQQAIAAEQQKAQRTRVLAEALGIPTAGALELLRHDPKTQGPLLFAQCASCHSHATAEGAGIVAAQPTAPNLYGFASRQWIRRLLDREIAEGKKVFPVAGPDYFGGTAFADGKMVQAVKDLWREAELDEELDELRADLDRIAAALSAEADLPAQRKLDAQQSKLIAQGRTAIVDRGCTNCHKFHDRGALGNAPDLTGYGSRRWTVDIINNPADGRFYGKRNDRMPAYAETMRQNQVEMLADWLRGDWYEPEQ